VSSKKTKPEPDDLFRSIPPQEQFHAFPALDAFPREAIAFLTGQLPAPERPDPKPRPPQKNDATTPKKEKKAAKSSVKPGPKPAAKPQTRPHSKPVSRPHSQPHSKPLSHTLDQSLDHTLSHTLDQSLDHTLSQTLDQPLDHTLSQTLDQSLDHTPLGKPQKIPGNTPADRLNDNQRNVLSYLLAVKPEIIRFAHIAYAVSLRENTIRTIMRRLAALDFLTFKKARDGNIQGIRVAFNHPRCEAFQTSAKSDHKQGQTLDHTLSQTLDHTLSQSLDHTLGQPDTRPHSKPDSFSPIKIDREESIYLLKEQKPCLKGWTDAFVDAMWPRVFAAGFRMEHLRSVLAARAKIGKGLDRDMLAVSLDRADWELERFGSLTDLGSGEKVKNTQGYLFTALARWGVLRPHPEYVSREELEAENAAKEIERRKQAAKLAEQALFVSWREALDPAELETLLLTCPGGPKEVWLKNHWRKNVRSGKDSGAGE